MNWTLDLRMHISRDSLVTKSNDEIELHISYRHDLAIKHIDTV